MNNINAGLPSGARSAVLACLLLSMAGWASASPQAQTHIIPAGASVESVTTLHGKTAVYQFALQTGIDISTFQKRTGSSPFDGASTNVLVTTTHRYSIPTAQALSGQLQTEEGRAHTLWSDGDTDTITWTDGCTRYTETYTWEGGATGGWVLTDFSMTTLKSAKCISP
jgi:hypothetical protein